VCMCVCARVCVCTCDVRSVRMPSRGDTLRWLGDDDLTSLSNKVADILKLDVGAGAESPSVGETRSPETEAAFSDSFFPRSGGQVVPDARSPTPDVSAVADAVDTVTLVTPVSAGVRGEKDVAAADVATESPHVAGAAGGRSTDTLLGTLAQFADETVSQRFSFCLVSIVVSKRFCFGSHTIFDTASKMCRVGWGVKLSAHTPPSLCLSHLRGHCANWVYVECCHSEVSSLQSSHFGSTLKELFNNTNVVDIIWFCHRYPFF